MRDSIFERFFRIDDASVGPQPGTGLGLYIGRGLAEQHGGSLTLESSEPGRGSTFVLRLPPAAISRLGEAVRAIDPAVIGDDGGERATAPMTG